MDDFLFFEIDSFSSKWSCLSMIFTFFLIGCSFSFLRSLQPLFFNKITYDDVETNRTVFHKHGWLKKSPLDTSSRKLLFRR